MLVKIICILANYGLLFYLNYKWSVDGISLKQAKANKFFTPILYFVISPYYYKSKGKRNHKKYELGLLLIEAMSHLFSIIIFIDSFFLKDFFWNLKGWSGLVFIFIVPLIGFGYMIINAIVKVISK